MVEKKCDCHEASLILCFQIHFSICGLLNLVSIFPGYAAPPCRALIKKKQHVACHETKPLTSEFKGLGQLLTSEVRSMTLTK